jgi:phosphate transport system substrate-binding protein
MGLGWRGAAVLAAVFWAGAATAQDATLTARDGGLSLSGDLVGYDGEFYRIRTRYGLLTVDAAGVICTGPACPDMTAPLAVIRIVGAAEPARTILPGLFAAFAKARGLRLAGAGSDLLAVIEDPATGEPLARIGFAAMPPDQASASVAEGVADLAVAALPVEGLGARILASEALVPLAAADNPLVAVSTADLARALSGEVDNWQALGGPDMPIVLHALAADVALQSVVEARLGAPVPATVLHPDSVALAAAVARDPWALALSGLSGAGAARVLPMTDSCGFPLPATPLAVKAEDYPLSAPIYLLTPKRRLPLLAREFLEFLATDAAQAAVAAAGYIDRKPTRAALTGDGQRLLNAIRNAGPEVSLEELQRLALAMTSGQRLSMTFRFQDGSTQLDAVSADNLELLGGLIAARAFDGYALVLAGFSDGSGAAATNLDLSRSRAEAVRANLARIAPDLREDQLPAVDAFGEALPIACDSSAAGRQANRRVELWLRPLSDWDGPREPAP